MQRFVARYPHYMPHYKGLILLNYYFDSEMINHVKNGMIKIKIKINFLKYKRLIKIKINLYESRRLKIKLHIDHILIMIKLNLDLKKITIRLIND